MLKGQVDWISKITMTGGGEPEKSGCLLSTTYWEMERGFIAFQEQEMLPHSHDIVFRVPGAVDLLPGTIRILQIMVRPVCDIFGLIPRACDIHASICRLRSPMQIEAAQL